MTVQAKRLHIYQSASQTWKLPYSESKGDTYKTSNRDRPNL